MTDSTQEVQAEVKHPTEDLAKEIINFTNDIDCLVSILPLMMQLMGAMKKEVDERLTKFIAEKAIDKKEERETTFFTIRGEDASLYNKLKQSMVSAENGSILIPRHFVTSLVSQYDSFLGHIVRYIFAAKPEKLNASEKAIPFIDLIKFVSIEEARESIIEKEVEAIIRKSHAEQFAWLKSTLDTPFNKDLKSWPIFIELTERRNLFVHCDGRVSLQYLKVCKEHNCRIAPELKVGDQLEVDPDYFAEAYSCIYEIGVKLAQVIWRKLNPDKLQQADRNIIDITYGLVEKRQYDLAIRLLEFFTEAVKKHSTDSTKRTLVINLAQSYKWKDNNERCLKIIAQYDWSASEDKFKLAVAVLRENYDTAYNTMKRLVHDDTFQKSFYKDWPLFKELRKQPGFAEAYQSCYGEPFKVRQKAEEEKKAVVEQAHGADGAPPAAHA